MSKYPFDKQLAGVVRYTSDRYGGLVPAMNFWKRHNYYAKGALSAARGWATVGENGPELIKLRGGEQIKSNRNSRRFINDAATSADRSDTWNIYGPDPEQVAREIERKRRRRELLSNV